MKLLILCIIILFVVFLVIVQVEWVFDELFLDSIKIFVVFQWGEYLFNFIYGFNSLKFVVGNEEEFEVFFFVVQESYGNGSSMFDILDIIELLDFIFVIFYIIVWMDSQGWVIFVRYF